MMYFSYSLYMKPVIKTVKKEIKFEKQVNFSKKINLSVLISEKTRYTSNSDVCF